MSSCISSKVLVVNNLFLSTLSISCKILYTCIISVIGKKVSGKKVSEKKYHF